MNAPQQQTREGHLAEVAQIAVRLDRETGCPAQLLITQWAIESRWGEKPTGHANYFGIKKAVRHTKCCTVTTREVIKGKSVTENLEFADYDSLEDSCRDYAWLIDLPLSKSLGQLTSGRREENVSIRGCLWSGLLRPAPRRKVTWHVSRSRAMCPLEWTSWTCTRSDVHRQ